MAERPLLLLPNPVAAAKANLSGGPGGPAKLSPERQQQRLGARLIELEKRLETKRIELQTSVSGTVPEDVLVLETAGTVDEFVKAVRKVSGLEFLAEFDEHDIPPDDDFFEDKKGARVPYTGRVYMVCADQAGFWEIQRLWKTFQRGDKFEHGFTNWRKVFGLLRDIRPWGVQDRLEDTGVLEDWKDRLEYEKDKVPCEIELWFRAGRQRQQLASQAVRKRIAELGGDVVAERVIPEIRYHGFAARLPIQAVQRVLDVNTRDKVQLVQSGEIQFFRAAGQVATRGPGEGVSTSLVLDGPLPVGRPRVALLDGLPLQNHVVLAGRLSIDDPDGFETGYIANAREHGTAMASLIIWGDLNRPEPSPIPEPLYVRPILRPVARPEWNGGGFNEYVPDSTLVVDLIHRAVLRLFDNDGDSPPAAPDVALVNFSIGIRDRPFSNTLSPLARLLDWLSWKYNVLFVVSAGNHLHTLETGKRASELEQLSPNDLARAILKSVACDTRNRRILSPAEALNVLTVGALHDDADTALPSSAGIDPLPKRYPSPLNAHGLGYRRSIKPDLLVSGGRLRFKRPLLASQTKLEFLDVATTPGIQVATPGARAGDLTHTGKSQGTSNAAAMLSRAGAFLAPILAELREGEGGNAIATVPDAVLIKALLAHGARWGQLGREFGEHFNDIADRDRRKDQITRLVGYGCLEIENVAECSKTRVTALGAGTLAKDRGAEHRFPLPPSLSGRRGWRRLTVTLAWFTPVNPLSHRWRKAHLYFGKPDSKLDVNRVGPDWQTARRGTLEHAVFEGEAAVAFLDGDDIVIRVSCREDAPGLEERVPYALVITLEVAEDLKIDVYAEVRDRVRLQIRQRSR